MGYFCNYSKVSEEELAANNKDVVTSSNSNVDVVMTKTLSTVSGVSSASSFAWISSPKAKTSPNKVADQAFKNLL